MLWFKVFVPKGFLWWIWYSWTRNLFLEVDTQQFYNCIGKIVGQAREKLIVTKSLTYLFCNETCIKEFLITLTPGHLYITLQAKE